MINDHLDKGFGIALKAVILNDGKFLILLRSRPSKGEPGYWELPGGRMMLGETYQAALKREIFEETGLNASLIAPLTVFDAKRDHDTQVVGITFLCKLNGDHKVITLSHEHLEGRWITLDELERYKIFPVMKREAAQWRQFIQLYAEK
jgi:8-oxo-dGTP diphosphatase